ncbi:GGGtGRT protein [Parasporobacterium paucivorans]|uniref:GGGtGRT protein n=1 Tax=Parasporobacterium paucivorans DSM 15970 TaxID=1122934 RepID=A0A1M6G6T0_9FIRM|nr:GGGtGRT protein [Parasporobacterium paucivorans]SHJ05652.1 GGGtGRT protein [Parasporobacterium paucivorans DSM 15970]
MALFESYERRIDKINSVLLENGIASIEEAEKITKEAGLDVYEQIKTVQPICFEDACWAYVVGAAIAIKRGARKASDAAAVLGEGLQAFCIPGSVADQRKVGIGHGNLGKMLLEEETECFCFLAGHESFAAAEGAIGIAEKANKVRQKPLRVILNGLGKDAAQIISRINGFTYVETDMNYGTGEVSEVFRKAYSSGLRAKVNCYGANDVTEGVAIMHKEGVDVSITGNSTNPTRFQHPVAGTYKKECVANGKKFFSVASGGGTGRTLHPDNMAAGPASYGMTDTMGRMHSDAQFAGSSSVPAHVEMMGLIGMGNNPMVGATVAVAVLIEEASKAGKF